jgi:hypothetical protein
MLLLRFSLLFLLITPTYAFNSIECLKSTFDADIPHKGELFGLIEHKFRIKKERCLISIYRQKLLPDTWHIDVCREPIHIKKESKGSINVMKRKGLCETMKEPGEFCEELASLLDIIQDDGLIFAEGERNKIDNAHGQVYCSYLLIKNYLQKGYVFSTTGKMIDIFDKKLPSCEIPNKPVDEPKKTQKKEVRKETVKKEKEEPKEVKTEVKF